MTRDRADAGPAPKAKGQAPQTKAHATLRELIVELARIAAAEDDAAERRRGVAA